MRPHYRRAHLTRFVAFSLVALLLSLHLQLDASGVPAALARGDPPGPPRSADGAPFKAFLPLIARPPEAYLPLIARARPAYDWLQFGGDPQHSNDNTQENILNRSNVNGLRLLFRVPLPERTDAPPVALSNVPTTLGLRDLLFVTTTGGSLLALDAQSGALIWMRSHDSPNCHLLADPSQPLCFTTSAPVIDPDRHYVYSYGLDGYVHKHRVEDGSEILGGGWPAMTTLKSFFEKGSSPLSLATARSGVSYVYATHASYPGAPGTGGDQGDYQGHVTAINLRDASQHVFNALCSDQVDVHFVEQPYTPDCSETQAGIWARAGVVYDPDNDRIYVTTGNGAFAPGQHHWGDTLFALQSDGTGRYRDPLDSYTPASYAQLDANDKDLGSTNVVILPVPANSSVPHLGMLSGKDAQLRLVNLDNLNGTGGVGLTGGEVGTPLTFPFDEVRTAPAVWVNPVDQSTWLFVTGLYGIGAYQLTFGAGGAPSLTSRWQQAFSATSPLVANGVLYTASDKTLIARDPVSGNFLWSTGQIGQIHWQSPIVLNGVLYCPDNNGYLTAFALPSN